MRPLLRSSLTHYAQGVLMGSADIIPGVSGGTMALIVGIYERLVEALSVLFSVVLALVRFDFAAARERLRAIEWHLLIPLGLGIGTAIVVGAKVIPHLLERYPVQCRGLFFGLIAASLAIPWRRIARRGAQVYGMAAVAAVAAFVLVGLPPGSTTDPSLLRVFASAAIAICAMILPGVSGAFLLLVLGLYEPTLHALNDRNVVYVLVFIAGAAVGLGLFSKALDWLLEHYHDRTMAALVGLMLGSLRALWPWQTPDRSLQWPSDGEPVLIVVVLAVLGFVFVAALAWWGAQALARSRTGP